MKIICRRVKGLKQIRKSQGLTQAALAKKLGVDQSAICDWELFKVKPFPHTVERIAKVLHVTLGEVYG
jgi:transcriptional regulator with XRE-family HTH domain